jgi:CRISPR system Cascade subunit CasD
MPEFLTFALTAPLAAMGEIAVGERRSSWDRPGRSAVLGLVAACMGLTREDEDAHVALENGYGLALRVQHTGPLLPDYHTTQVPPSRRGRRFATRAEELCAPDLETILSRRDYRTGVSVLVALWSKPRARWQLSEIEEALLKPQYVPYFGRKSCPLMLPMAPRRVEAINPLAALSDRVNDGPVPERQLLERRSAVTTMSASEALEFDLRIERIEVRRDALASRRRWQFSLREEAILSESP